MLPGALYKFNIGRFPKKAIYLSVYINQYQILDFKRLIRVVINTKKSKQKFVNFWSLSLGH